MVGCLCACCCAQRDTKQLPTRIAICARARALAVSTHQLDELLVAHLPVFIALDEG